MTRIKVPTTLHLRRVRRFTSSANMTSISESDVRAPKDPNQDLQNILARASMLIRQGFLAKAESLFRQVLSRELSRRVSLVEEAGKAEAYIGLAEICLSQHRRLTGRSNEAYWLLFRGLVFLQQCVRICSTFVLKHPSEEGETDEIRARFSLLSDDAVEKQKMIADLVNCEIRKSLSVKVDNISQNPSFPIIFNDSSFSTYYPLPDNPTQANSVTFLLNSPSSMSSFLRYLYEYFIKRAVNPAVVDDREAEKYRRSVRVQPRRFSFESSAIVLPPSPIIYEQTETRVTDVGQEVRTSVSDLRRRLGLDSRTLSLSQRVPTFQTLLDQHKKHLEIIASKETSDIIEYEARTLFANLQNERDSSRLNQVRKSHTINDFRLEKELLCETENVPQRVAVTPQTEKSFFRFDSPVDRHSRPVAFRRSSEQLQPNHFAFNFEEISPVTEVHKISTVKTQISTYSNHGGMNDEELGEIFTQLIRAMSKLGDQLYAQAQFATAYHIYEQTLFIYQLLDQDITQDRTIPYLLRRLGIIRCHYGNIYGGISLMERAFEMYNEELDRKGLCKTIPTIEKATVWYEMGNAYLTEGKGLNLARQAVGVAIRNFIKKELLEEGDTLLDEPQTNLDEEVYHVGAVEAEACYGRSQNILCELKSTCGEDMIWKNLKVRLLTRQGDCCIINSSYDDAVEIYEKALSLLPSTVGSGLMEINGHVLCMLGIGRMLLGNFSKAMAVLECAHLIFSHQTFSTRTEVKEDARYFISALMTLCCVRTSQPHATIVWGKRSVNLFRERFGHCFERLKDTNDCWLLSEVFVSLGQSQAMIGEHANAILTFHTVLGIDIGIENDIFLYSRLLRLLGQSQQTCGHDEAAVASYKLALQAQDAHAGQCWAMNYIRSSICSSLSRVLYDLDRPDEGALYQLQRSRMQSCVDDELTGSLVSLHFEVALGALHDYNLSKAQENLTAALAIYKEQHGELASDMIPLVIRLASLSHVMSLLKDYDIDVASEAENLYRECLKIEYNSPAALKYSYLLYDLGRSDEAIDAAQLAIEYDPAAIIFFEHYEDVALPPPVDTELHFDSELELHVLSYGLFLLVIFSKERDWHDLADEAFLFMWSLADNSALPHDHILLGYTMLEYGLFVEAARVFLRGASLERWSRQITIDNALFSLVLAAWEFLANVCKFFYHSEAELKSPREIE